MMEDFIFVESSGKPDLATDVTDTEPGPYFICPAVNFPFSSFENDMGSGMADLPPDMGK